MDTEIKTNVNFLEDKNFRLKLEKVNTLVEAVTPYIKENSKILFVDSQKEPTTEFTIKSKNVSVETIFLENDEDFLNYPDDKLESYDYVVVNPLRYRLNCVMKKLFSTKVPFVLIVHFKEALFVNKERLTLMNENNCSFMSFYKSFLSKGKDGGEPEMKVFPLETIFLCRDVFPEKFLSVKIRKNTLTFI
jgi:hypothetical protein